MGNDLEMQDLMNQHYEEMQSINNEHDIKQKQILLNEKIAEYNLEKHRREIERLAKLDRYHFEAEVQKIRAGIRKNDQFHERESKIINNVHIENMTKEANRNDNANNKMKLDFTIQEMDKKLYHKRELTKINNIHEENNSKINNNLELNMATIYSNHEKNMTRMNYNHEISISKMKTDAYLTEKK